MEQTNETTRTITPGERSALDYVLILWRWRKFIAANILGVAVIAIIVSLLLPKWYKAKASILPPKDPDLLGTLSSANSVFRSLAGAGRISGLKQSMGLYNYLAILKSRSAMEDVVRKFNLTEVYDISDSSMEETIKALRENASFEMQEDDYLLIEILDKDPARAAAMANHFVDVLNDVSIKLGTREAHNNREFIENRLEGSQADLRTAEEKLRGYQERTGVLISPDQNASGISSIAELYVMREKKEVELAILVRRLSESNDLVQTTRLELNELNKKLSTIPQSGLEAFRLYRDVVIQQKIVEYLIPAYEQSKLEEQKNIPVLLVLDKAVAPEKKDRPKRILIVTLSVIAALFLNVVLILAYETILRNTSFRLFIRSEISRV
ncbi:MAG TPA: GNVR domain-containing protein [Bacteroidota bacterium]|nr:GNVR domain-containing protein [Bacteroidota bacterium]